MFHGPVVRRYLSTFASKVMAGARPALIHKCHNVNIIQHRCWWLVVDHGGTSSFLSVRVLPGGGEAKIDVSIRHLNLETYSQLLQYTCVADSWDFIAINSYSYCFYLVLI